MIERRIHINLMSPYYKNKICYRPSFFKASFSAYAIAPFMFWFSFAADEEEEDSVVLELFVTFFTPASRWRWW